MSNEYCKYVLLEEFGLPHPDCLDDLWLEGMMMPPGPRSLETKDGHPPKSSSTHSLWKHDWACDVQDLLSSYARISQLFLEGITQCSPTVIEHLGSSMMMNNLPVYTSAIKSNWESIPAVSTFMIHGLWLSLRKWNRALGQLDRCLDPTNSCTCFFV